MEHKTAAESNYSMEPDGSCGSEISSGWRPFLRLRRDNILISLAEGMQERFPRMKITVKIDEGMLNSVMGIRFESGTGKVNGHLRYSNRIFEDGRPSAPEISGRFDYYFNSPGSGTEECKADIEEYMEFSRFLEKGIKGWKYYTELLGDKDAAFG